MSIVIIVILLCHVAFLQGEIAFFSNTKVSGQIYFSISFLRWLCLRLVSIK